MSGTTTRPGRNLADLPVLPFASGMKIIMRKGIGEVVVIDPATTPAGPAGPPGSQGPVGPAGSTGPAGPAGPEGRSVLNGAGAPSNGVGANGDFYVDTASADYRLYGPKSGGVWAASTFALKGPQGQPGSTGAAGNTILSGNGGPPSSLGVNGDYYLDRASADYLMYGPKTAGAWGTGFALKGSGAGPAGPTGATGAPGEDGTSVLSGTGAPNNATGQNGDFWLDLGSADYRLYGPKAGGVWPTPGVALKGANGAAGVDGRTWLSGSGTPAAGLGANGDFYVDLASASYLFYGPKTAGAWGTGRALKGPQGDTGPQGPQGPAGTSVALGSTAGLALGTAGAAGTSTTAARSDHVHPRPTVGDIGAAPAVHSHDIGQITNLQTALDGKAGVNHNHSISSVINLQPALDGKQDTAQKGAANGYASLDSGGKVPLAQLPSNLGGSGTAANIDNGTAAGQIPTWSATLGKWVASTGLDIVQLRVPVVERAAATALTFAAHNERLIVLSGTAPLTLAAAEIGTAPNQGMAFTVMNNAATVNTITFASGIEVDQPASGTGTSGQVKIAAKNGTRRGKLYVQVVPMGSALVAVCEGDAV